MAIDYDAINARRASAAAPIPITDENQSRVADTLASAFEQDPILDWFLRDDDKREFVRKKLIEGMVDRYIKSGWAIAANDGSCATLWARPGKPADDMGLLQQLAQLPNMIRLCSLSRLKRIIKVMSTLEANHPHEPDHYYLFMIGVNAEFQGQGLGSSILEATLAQVDREGMPAYLENSNPKNTPFYERHGFKVTKEIKLMPDGPPLWPMWRNVGGT